MGQPAYLENPSRYDTFRNHEPMRPTDVEGVGLMAPLGAALSAGQGMGPVFLGGPLHLPHVVLAVAFDPKLGGGKRILAAEVSLRKLAAYVASLSTAEVDVKLVDPRARLFASGARGGPALLETQPVPGGGREGELPPHELVAEYVDQGRRLIGAYAPVQPWGLGAIVDKTVGAALAPVNRIRTATALWIFVSVFLGSLAAGILARRLAGRVAVLASGSRRIATGNLGTRIAEQGGRRAHRSRSGVQSDGGRASRRRDGKSTSRRAKSWPGTRVSRNASTTKRRSCGRTQDLSPPPSRSLSALHYFGAGIAAGKNRQDSAHGALGVVSCSSPITPPPSVCALYTTLKTCEDAADQQDHYETCAPFAATERSRHQTAESTTSRARRRHRAVRTILPRHGWRSLMPSTGSNTVRAGATPVEEDGPGCFVKMVARP